MERNDGSVRVWWLRIPGPFVLHVWGAPVQLPGVPELAAELLPVVTGTDLERLIASGCEAAKLRQDVLNPPVQR